MSLTAAAVVLIIGVSALIGFRGFRTARQDSVQQRVVLPATGAERGARGSAPVVIGGAERRRPARRPAITTVRRRPRTRAAKVKRAPARSRRSAPTPSKPGKVRTAPPATQERQPAAPAPAATAAPTANPVGQLLDDVTGVVESVKPVETVGDVLLDLRDVLP